MSERIPMSKIAKLNTSIYQVSENIQATAPYIEKHVIVRHGAAIEGIVLYGVTNKSLKNIFYV